MKDETQLKTKYEELSKKSRELRGSSRDYRRNEEYRKKKPIPYWRHKCILDIENVKAKKEILKWVLGK